MSIDKIDQEIQNSLDKKLQREPLDEETKTYVSVYKALNTLSVDDYLPSTFADTVIDEIKMNSSNKNAEAYWWFGSMIVFMLLTGVIIIALMMGTMKIEVNAFISKYTPMVVLITLIIGGVQWLDKRLIKFHT